MIKLYSFGPSLNVPDPSPFVLKVNLLLTVSKQPFEVLSGTQYLQKAPKGKLPYIEDNDKTVTDSFFIEKYLKDTYKFDVNSHLSTEQKAISHLACASLEERLYWCIVYFRWVYQSNWEITKPTFFGGMPFPLNKIVPNIARKGMIKAMHGHGIGRHSEAEILQIAQAQLQAISDLIGDKEYFFNNKLCLLDITSYAMLAQILLSNMPSPLVELTKEYSNLVAFCERIHSAYYG